MVAYIIISANAVITFVSNKLNYQLNSYLVKAVIAFGIMFPLSLLKSLK